MHLSPCQTHLFYSCSAMRRPPKPLASCPPAVAACPAPSHSAFCAVGAAFGSLPTVIATHSPCQAALPLTRPPLVQVLLGSIANSHCQPPCVSTANQIMQDPDFNMYEGLPDLLDVGNPCMGGLGGDPLLDYFGGDDSPSGGP